MRRCWNGGKIRYATRKRAVKARDHSNSIRGPLDPEVNFMYRCEACGGWHLTKREQHERAAA
jgi:hypothetical protein